MSIRFYMDVQIHIAITEGLRRRGVDVLRAQEDGASRFPDPRLLDRASVLRRVLFTNDDDFTVEAAIRQADGRAFDGIVYAHPLKVTIGQCIEDLEAIAIVFGPDDMNDRLVYLPL